MNDGLTKRLERLVPLVGNEELRTVCLQARDALEAKDAGYRKLVALLDDAFGTPCEQVRHKQEIEAKDAEIVKAHQDAEDMAGKCLRQRAVVKAAQGFLSTCLAKGEPPYDWSVNDYNVAEKEKLAKRLRSLQTALDTLDTE